MTEPAIGALKMSTHCRIPPRSALFSAFVVTLAAGSPARAETVRDWYVELKRTAKELRIAAQLGQGTRVADKRAIARQLAFRAGTTLSGTIPVSCRDASNELVAAGTAAERGKAADYADAMRRYAGLDERCFSDFTRAEQTASSVPRVR